MSTDAERDDETGPDALTDDEFLAGLGELAAYQARYAPPAAAELPSSRPPVPIRPMSRHKPAEPREDMKGDIALTSWPVFAVAFALSFGAVLWLSRGGSPAMGPGNAVIAGNAIAASDPIAAPAVAASALSVGQTAGRLLPTSSPTASRPAAPAPAVSRQAAARPVTVQTSRAVKREQTVSIRGRTEAAARVPVKAETSGVVQSVGPAKGARVQKGDALCTLEPGAQGAALDEARAQLAYAEQVVRGSTRLAEAAVRKAEIEMNRTRIVAPFAGVVEDQPARPGTLLGAGSVCAVVIAPDPLFVVGVVAEQGAGRVQMGMKGAATLITGETVAGFVAFVGSTGDTKARTFRVELQVPNPEGKLRDGVTAMLQIPTTGEAAHVLAPSALTMNKAGELGVRVVDQAQTSRFMPVKVLGDERERIWVSGLPSEVKIIVAGQDDLADGQRVGITERQPPRAAR